MIKKIDGNMLRNMIVLSSNKLAIKRDLLDSLNVFPVPDGDTGTNMSLTILAAAKEVAQVKDKTIKEISQLASSGSLRGARGNSGVIVSQLYRGFATAFKDKEYATIEDIADGFLKAKETAYKAVLKPKEGTILTVASALAEKALEIKDEVKDFDVFFSKIINHGNIVLEKTTDMLEVLKEANVVDSGAKGLMTIVEAWREGLRAENMITLNIDRQPQSSVELPKGVYYDTSKIEFAYCTEFLIVLESYDDAVEDKLKNSIEKLGDSLVVVVDGKIVKIHVHTNNPGRAIEESLKYGMIDGIKIENMIIQNEELVSLEAEKNKNTLKKEKPIGIIAISQGEGMNSLFEDLGVDYVIKGGQSMNPSTEEILQGANEVNSKNIIILANNKNIFLACDQASKESMDKNIFVVRTESMQQGVGALLSYFPVDEPEKALESLNSGIKGIKSLQVTYAVRKTKNDKVNIEKGDYLYLIENKIVNANKNIHRGTMELIESAVKSDSIVTIYYGNEVDESSTNKIAKEINEKYPDIEVTIYKGDQPIYYYLISVE